MNNLHCQIALIDGIPWVRQRVEVSRSNLSLYPIYAPSCTTTRLTWPDTGAVTADSICRFGQKVKFTFRSTEEIMFITFMALSTESVG